MTSSGAPALDSSSEEDEFAMIFLGFMLMLCVASLIDGSPPKWLRKVLPAPITLFTVSLIVGLIGSKLQPNEGFVSTVASFPIGSEVLQALYLPPLLFSDAMHMNLKVFRKSFWQVNWLVFPGVVAGAALTALFPLYLMPSGPPYFTVYESFAFGGALSTTDPIAVLMILSDIGAPKRLAAVVSGESLLNDGSSMIIVTLFLQLQAGAAFNAGKIVKFCFQELLVGPCIGVAIGFLVLLCMSRVQANIISLVTLSFAAPYVTFVVCLFYVETSGVLAVIALGIVLNRFGKGFLSLDFHTVEAFWDQVEFLAVMTLYFQVGLFVATDFLQGAILAIDWLSLLLIFLFILLVRLVVILASYPILSRIGYGLSFKESIVVWHAGLRGAISVLLSLSIKTSPGVSERTGALVLFFTAGIVVLMLFNIVTTKPLCRLLGIDFDKNDKVYARMCTRLEENTLQTLILTGMSESEARKGIGFPLASPSADNVSGSAGSGLPQMKRNNILLPPSVDDALMSTKRRHVCATFKATFQSLQIAKLIPRRAWLILVNACEKLIDAEEVDRLLRLDDIIGKGSPLNLSSRLAKKVYGWFIKRSQKNWQRLNQAVDGSFSGCVLHEGEKNEDILGIVETLTYCAFALIIAHQRGRRLIHEIFFTENTETGMNRMQHPNEVQRIQDESRLDCEEPAKLIDFVFCYFPVVIERIKRSHAKAQVHDKNLQLLGTMKRTGFAHGVALQQLFKEVEKLDNQIGRLTFKVIEPFRVGSMGSQLAQNPNFGPFAPHGSLEKSGSLHWEKPPLPTDYSPESIDPDNEVKDAPEINSPRNRTTPDPMGRLLSKSPEIHDQASTERLPVYGLGETEDALVVDGNITTENNSGSEDHDHPSPGSGELDRVLDRVEQNLAHDLINDPDFQVMLN